MPDLIFNTPEGQTVSRHMMIAYLNTGTGEVPVWSPIGKRVEDSAAEFDWQKESKKDILNNTYSTMKDPIISQSFDAWELDGGDAAQLKIWNLAIRDHDAQALANQDVLIVHLYAGTADTSAFAERYEASAIEASGLGGEGGGSLAMPITITYGGKREKGTAAVSGDTVTFSPET